MQLEELVGVQGKRQREQQWGDALRGWSDLDPAFHTKVALVCLGFHRTSEC